MGINGGDAQDAGQRIPGLTFTCHQYGPHPLHRAMVWEPTSPSNSTTGYWIVYAFAELLNPRAF